MDIGFEGNLMATLLSEEDLTGIVAHSASLFIATCSPSDLEGTCHGTKKLIGTCTLEETLILRDLRRC